MGLKVLTSQIVGPGDGPLGIDQVGDAPREALLGLVDFVGAARRPRCVGQQSVREVLVVREVLLRLDGVETGADDDGA